MKPNDQNSHALSQVEVTESQLSQLKSSVARLHSDIACLMECTRLNDFLQKMYEIREGLNRLEQGLLQSHLKCCISPTIRVPGEIALAVSRLSEKRHGAIIALERDDPLDQHLQGGIFIDAAVSAPILESIFCPGSPLHDGALIIRNSRIRKASVFLPLAPHTSELAALGLGSRHRAALGLSQLSDALIIVVSEVKGWISIALRGQLYPNLGTFAFSESVEGHNSGNRFEAASIAE